MEPSSEPVFDQLDMALRSRGSSLGSQPSSKNDRKEPKRRLFLILLTPSAAFAILTHFVYLTCRAAYTWKGKGGIIARTVLLVEALISGTS